MRLPRHRLVPIVALLLIASGGAAMALAVTSSDPTAPQPGVAAAGWVDIPPAAAAPPTQVAASPQAGLEPGKRGALVLPRSRPVRLRIPTIGLDASVDVVGLTAAGALQVPAAGPGYDLPAWYRGSPTPGELGPAVVVGHVDSWTGPSVFFRLGALHPGDQVQVTRADGSRATFLVTGVRRYAKSRFPTRLVYGPVSYAALRLITCGGPFDRTSGHYRDNTIVFAVLTATRR